MKKTALFGFLLVAVLGVCGCGKHTMPYTYSPMVNNQAMTESSLPLAIIVHDVRPYIADGRKDANFAGIIRASFGIPKDVITERGVAFSFMLKNDLIKDLRNAGYTVVENGAERYVEINILDYNFDCFSTCRVWHEIQILIKSKSGKILHSRTIIDDAVVDNVSPYNGYTALRNQMPAIYTKVVQDLVRNDPEAIAALQRSPAD
jgi:hypothetical protein